MKSTNITLTLCGSVWLGKMAINRAGYTLKFSIFGILAMRSSKRSLILAGYLPMWSWLHLRFEWLPSAALLDEWIKNGEVG